MSDLNFQTRRDHFSRLNETVFDLLIVGGGINGAGAAREAVQRGLSVALVEAHDFAEGTSSRSSKLIHGGIRYLENFDFHLVFEALSERAKLIRMAPHLVHPLRFQIPIYKNSRVGMFKMGLGMWLYSALALFEEPEPHERLSSQESQARQPLLGGADLVGSYVYSDAYMDDDRLVLETLRSAADEGLVVCNFVKAVGYKNPSTALCEIDVQDQITGETKKVRARHVLSTVGPWTDQLAGNWFSDWKSCLRPTKGVHLTFSRERFPLSSAVVMAAQDRIVFAIPRHEMVIVGTTDTDFKGDPGLVSVTPEDVAYLLKITHQYFPQANLQESDILSSYAGVRPLVQDGASTEGKTSREHEIWTRGSVTFVSGGKYTTYRLIAEQAIQECLKSFPLENQIRWASSRSLAPLNPLIDVDSLQFQSQRKDWLKIHTRLNEFERERLVDRHGQEAQNLVLRYGSQLTYWQYEAHHAIDTTMCLNLTDFYFRRTPLKLSFRDNGLQFLPEIAIIFQEKLSWSAEQLNQQIANLKRLLQTEHKWRTPQTPNA